MSKGVKDKKLFFIVNPVSGGGTAAAFWDASLPLLDAAGYTYSWEYTRPGEICGQIRRAVLEENAEVVIAVGGDGTLYDTINALVCDDKLIRSDIILAAYPTGSACDFSRSIYPGGKCSLHKLIENSSPRLIDIGRCRFDQGDCRYFINSFDIGAGADTCEAVNNNSGKVKRFWRNGRIAFKLTALKILMNFNYTVTEIELDDEKFSGEYIIMGCGNGAYIGGGMMLFPQASLTDGKLDLLLIPRKTRLQILKLFTKVYDGTILDIDGVVYRQTGRARFASARPVAAELDGEIPGCAPLEVSVLGGLLPLLLPEE